MHDRRPPEDTNKSASWHEYAADHPLDIVRDCADLAGAFPENVRLHFVLWIHGHHTAAPSETSYTANDARAVAAYHSRLAPALIGAEAVGLEVALPTQPTDVEHGFRMVNVRTQDWEPGKPIPSIITSEVTTSQLALTGIIHGLVKQGAQRLPPFFPVDIYGHPELHTPMRSLLPPHAEKLSYEQYVRQLAPVWRKREEVVLRQTHEAAVELARDRQPHEIAIVQGSVHGLAAVAARLLGARVVRSYLDGAYVTPISDLVRAIRLAGDTDLPPESFQACLWAQWLAFSMLSELERRTPATDQSELTRLLQERAQSVVEARVGTLCLRGFANRLPPARQAHFQLLANYVATHQLGADTPDDVIESMRAFFRDSLVKGKLTESP